MRYALHACLVAASLPACNYAPLPRLAAFGGGDAGPGDDAEPPDSAPPGVVALRASPSLFVLHQSDTRDTALVLSNGTAEAIDLPTGFTVSGLVGGTLTFAANTCGTQLAAGASCGAVSTLVASATVQTTFDVSLGAASVRLSMTALPACPATCGIFGTTNCCASAVVPGNAPGATLDGQTFYRDHDNAADGTYASKTATASVSDFRLDTYEVTVGRFRAFLNAGMGTSATAPGQGAGAHAQIPDSGWDPTWSANLEDSNTRIMLNLKCDSPDLRGQTWTDAAGTPSDESRPITCTNWYEAMAFCIWDGGYLPTEAEWNYAASGGHDQRPYPWSTSDSSTTIGCSNANYGIQDCRVAPMPVGDDSPAGDGKWGTADLAGNAAEWTLDWYSSSYPDQCQDCAALAPGTERVLRGGGFDDPAASVRVDLRGHSTPRQRVSDHGLRCARMR